MTLRSSHARGRVQHNERLREWQGLRPRAKARSDPHTHDINGRMQHRGHRYPVNHAQISGPVRTGANDDTRTQATAPGDIVRMNDDLHAVAVIIPTSRFHEGHPVKLRSRSAGDSSADTLESSEGAAYGHEIRQASRVVGSHDIDVPAQPEDEATLAGRTQSSARDTCLLSLSETESRIAKGSLEIPHSYGGLHPSRSLHGLTLQRSDAPRWRLSTAPPRCSYPYGWKAAAVSDHTGKNNGVG